MLQGELQCRLGSAAPDRERLEWPAQVLGRGRRAGEVRDRVDSTGHLESLRDIREDELEAVALLGRLQVFLATAREVVDADDLVAAREECLAKMRPDEAGASGHDEPAQTTPIPS